MEATFAGYSFSVCDFYGGGGGLKLKSLQPPLALSLSLSLSLSHEDFTPGEVNGLRLKEKSMHEEALSVAHLMLRRCGCFIHERLLECSWT